MITEFAGRSETAYEVPGIVCGNEYVRLKIAAPHYTWGGIMIGEIEQDQWATYLDEFSRRNAMRPARLEIIGEEVGAQEAAQHTEDALELEAADGVRTILAFEQLPLLEASTS